MPAGYVTVILMSFDKQSKAVERSSNRSCNHRISYAVVTTTIRLRFDRRSSVLQWVSSDGWSPLLPFDCLSI